MFNKQLAGVLCALLLCAAQASAQSKHEFGYLVDATNKIYAIQSQNSNLSKEQLREIASTACTALRRLEADSSFQRTVVELERLQASNRDRNMALIGDLNAFFGSFLLEEIELLRKAELSEASVVSIASSMSFMNNALERYIEPSSVFETLDKLRGEVCGASENLNDLIREAEETASRWRLAWRWARGIGGAVVIGVDGAAMAPTAGIASASYTIGGALVLSSIPQ